jgi:hypothetical protein
MIQTCVNINCNIGIETLWFLLGHICSYYSVSLANNRVNSSTEQCIGLVWLRIKSICFISRKKKVMKLLASYKSGISWPLAWLLPIQERLHFIYFLVWPLLPTHCRFRGSLLHVLTHTHTHTHTKFSVFVAQGNDLNRYRDWRYKSDQCVAEVTPLLWSRCCSHVNTSVYLTLVNITFCKARIV